MSSSAAPGRPEQLACFRASLCTAGVMSRLACVPAGVVYVSVRAPLA